MGMGQNHAKPHSYHIWVNKHPLTNYSNNSHIIPRNIIFVVAENCIFHWHYMQVHFLAHF